MSNRLTKTDNSYMGIKLKVRKLAIDNMPDKKRVRVLDAYSGQGLTWKTIHTDRPQIDMLIDEIELKGRPGVYLRGDNLKYLAGMNLSQYDIIDLDAYGIPYKQLEIIFSRRRQNGKKVIIIFTFIQTLFGVLPKGMLLKLGYTPKMISKIPSLFNRNGFEKFKQYLACRGIRRINYISVGQKHYGSFEITL